MAAAASPERPLGQAHSETWLAAQKNVVRIFDDKFRASSPRRQAAYPTPWLGMSESQVINPTMYEDFLKYLVDEYVVEAGRSRGERLAVHSVMNYLGCLLQIASNRFKAAGSPEAKLFFTWRRCRGRERLGEDDMGITPSRGGPRAVPPGLRALGRYGPPSTVARWPLWGTPATAVAGAVTARCARCSEVTKYVYGGPLEASGGAGEGYGSGFRKYGNCFRKRLFFVALRAI